MISPAVHLIMLNPDLDLVLIPTISAIASIVTVTRHSGETARHTSRRENLLFMVNSMLPRCDEFLCFLTSYTPSHSILPCRV